jgi:hypothetical protein
MCRIMCKFCAICLFCRFKCAISRDTRCFGILFALCARFALILTKKATRHQLLVGKPQQKLSWIGLAMAHHMLGEYDMALSVLDTFNKTQEVRDDAKQRRVA